MKLAIFGSGRGSNFQAIHHAIETGLLLAEIAVVVVNKPGAPMVKFAESLHIPTIVVSSEQFPSREDHEAKILNCLDSYDFDLIILAGYMRILSKEFVDQFQNRILNIHPSLLPSFPGLHAQKQALDHGVRITGVTVHLVNNELDAGQILSQRCVEVLKGDTEETLSHRMLKVEHQLYAETIQKICIGEITLPITRVI